MQSMQIITLNVELQYKKLIQKHVTKEKVGKNPFITEKNRNARVKLVREYIDCTYNLMALSCFFGNYLETIRKIVENMDRLMYQGILKKLIHSFFGVKYATLIGK